MGIYLVYAMNAFLVTALLITWLRPVAVRLSLVDRPDARKLHEGAIPVCGGIAMFAAIMISNVGLGFDRALSPVAALCLCVIAVAGFIDDRRQLSARTRLVIQGTAAVVLVVLGLDGPIQLLGPVPAEFVEPLLLVGPLVAVIFIMGTINAINMMDGVDGLAGGYLTLSFFWLALLAQSIGRTDIAIEALVLMSAVVGFLVFNLRHRWRSRASVFMGDAGSTMLGAAIAFLIVKLASGPDSLPFPLLLWLVIVPVTDTLVLIVTRMAAGRSPFQPDRRHLHHLLQDRGFSSGQVAALLIAVSFFYGAVAYGALLLRIPESVMLGALVIPVGLHVGFVTATGRRAIRAATGTAAPQQTLPNSSLADRNPGNA
ncbi:MAG TPA: MraY family glycosyltransferase [Devosiaceae bacterium]|jgi:UDP-GlcNAc:undecaprenyl-phosphate GlcNAc-1-phosphate transferase